MIKDLQKSYVTILFAGIIIGIFAYVWIFGVNVLYLDEWSFVPLIKKFQSSGLSFDMLFKQHNEHRIFFPRLFYIAFFPLSNMNSKFYMFFNAIMLCTVFLCLFQIAKKQFSFTLSRIPVWIIIIPLFVFNLRQSTNLLWAFQIAFYMVLAFAVLSLFLIEKAVSANSVYLRSLYIFIAIVCAIIATYSSAMGAMVWFAGGAQLLLKNNYFKVKRIHLWIYILSWIIIGGIGICFYYSGLNSTIKQNVLYLIDNPFKFIHFFFSLISLTSVHSLSIIAFPIGIVIFSVSIFALLKAYKNKRLKENSFWIALSVFSIMFSLITTIGRSPTGFDFTDRARYTIFTSLFVISTFMLFYDYYITSAKETGRKIFRVYFACMILLALELNAIGFAFGIRDKNEKETFKQVVLDYKHQSVRNGIQAAQSWCNNPEFLNMVDESVPFIEQNQYNVFAEKK